MDVALQSSVWVTSPEFSGWLLKRGFHVRKFLEIVKLSIIVHF